MSLFAVDNTSAVPLRRKSGTQVTIQNNSPVDVYIDEDGPNRLNSTPANATPNGFKVAKLGGQVQFYPFPGCVWMRADGAVGPTTVEVVGGTEWTGRGNDFLKSNLPQGAQ